MSQSKRQLREKTTEMCAFDFLLADGTQSECRFGNNLFVSDVYRTHICLHDIR